MKILHLSDIHYREYYEKTDTGYLSALAMMTSPLVHLEKCFSQIDRSTLDSVAITGDLCEAGSARDYRILKSFLHKYICKDLPLIVTLGNHDDKAAFHEGWDLPMVDSDNKNSPYNSFLDVTGIRIISIDNAILGYPDGAIIPEQFLWLQRVLQQDANRKVVLILHHHLLNTQADIPSASWDPVFPELLKKHGILGILCGHTHFPYHGDFMGIPYTTAPSMSFQARQVQGKYLRFEENPGYQICHFGNEGMKVKTIYLYDQPRYLKTIPLSDFMPIRQ